MKKTLLTLLAATIATAAAAQAPAWLRNSAISPDGSRIAFTYKGIYSPCPWLEERPGKSLPTKPMTPPRYGVPTEKTGLRQQPRRESRRLHRRSRRGTPVRLTTSSADEQPLAFIDSDNLAIISKDLGSNRSVRFPGQSNVYSINLDKPGSRPQLWLSFPAMSAKFLARRKDAISGQERDGKRVA